MRYVVVAIAVFTLLLVSCSRGGQASAESETGTADDTEAAMRVSHPASARTQTVTGTGAPRPQPPATREQPPASRLEQAIPQTTSAEPRDVPDAPAPVARPLLQSDRILSRAGGGRFGPDDYEIGPLSMTLGDASLREITAAVTRFQELLASGTYPAAVVDVEWRDHLQRSLIFHLERGRLPTSVRVGLIDLYVPGRARAEVRLYGDPGWTVGEIYLTRNDGAWYIEDLQINLALLEQTPAPRERDFEPTNYAAFGVVR